MAEDFPGDYRPSGVVCGCVDQVYLVLYSCSANREN